MGDHPVDRWRLRHGCAQLRRRHAHFRRGHHADHPADSEKLLHFTASLRRSMYHTFQSGEGTRDLNGPTGNTTEQFVAAVASRLSSLLAGKELPAIGPKEPALPKSVQEADGPMREMFAAYDTNNDGMIDFEEFKK